MICINRDRFDFFGFLCCVDLGSQKNGFFNGLLGAFVMLAIALIFNNIPKTRKYPEFWL